MESLKFKEDSAIINYSPIQSPTQSILIEKKNFDLGEYFLKPEIHNNPIRVKHYNLSNGYFKKYLDECIKKNQLGNPNSPVQPPSRKEAVLLFKSKNSKKFNQAVTLNQPPRKYRWSVWYINLTFNNMLSNDSYQRLIRSYKQDVIEIVKKDVPRTFSTNPFFKDKILKIEVGREMLYKTCKAIGTYFPDVGYCQGLNFLVGFMLQVSGGVELEVVNAIISLCTDSRFLGLGVYDTMFPVVQFLKKMFWKVLYKIDRKLAVHLKNTGLPDDVWLTKWFISFFTGYFSPYYAARFLDLVFNQDIFVMPVIAAVVASSLKSQLMGQDMDVVNDVIQNLKNLDDKKNKKMLPEPQILIKKVQKYLFKPKDIMKTMDEFMVDKEYYGQEEFKKYLHPYRDYLITGKGKHIDFKIFDFAAESIRAPVSQMSMSQISERSLRMSATPRGMPPDSDVRVPDESFINNVMPNEFNLHQRDSNLNMFKRKSVPEHQFNTPVVSKLSIHQIPLNIENSPIRIAGTDVEMQLNERDSKGMIRGQFMPENGKMRRPSIVQVQSKVNE